MEIIAGKLAKMIRSNHPNPASEAVLTYSLIIVLNNIFTVLLTITISIFTGRVLECLLALGLFAFLRFFSGGTHLQSSFICSLISAIVIACIATVQFDYYYIGLIMTSIACIIALFRAPYGLKGHSRIKEQYYPLMKAAAVVIIGSNLMIQSPLLSIVFLTQSLTLTSLFNKLVNLLEGRNTQ